jgi:hypothetical protein
VVAGQESLHPLVGEDVITRETIRPLATVLTPGQRTDPVPPGRVGRVANRIVGRDRYLVDFGEYGLRWVSTEQIDLVDLTSSTYQSFSAV